MEINIGYLRNRTNGMLDRDLDKGLTNLKAILEKIG
jgi:hypothetical protein